MIYLKHCQCFKFRVVLLNFTFEALALQVPGGHFLIFFICTCVHLTKYSLTWICSCNGRFATIWIIEQTCAWKMCLALLHTFPDIWFASSKFSCHYGEVMMYVVSIDRVTKHVNSISNVKSLLISTQSLNKLMMNEVMAKSSI